MPVIYVDIDSLRPDHITPYGYEKDTTPNLDKLADDSAIFDRAYVANSPCMPSRAGSLTGRYGINNGVETHRVRGRTINGPNLWDDFNGEECDWWTLPETFFHERIQTGAVSSFPRHTSPWFYHLWHEFYQPQEPRGSDEYFQTPRAETVADHAIQFLNKYANEDFFLYTQFWDPHTPYNRSDEEIAEFDTGYLPPYPTSEQVDEHQSWNTWHSATAQEIKDRSDLSSTIAHYDAEISYVDNQIGILLDKLRQEGIYDEALIVVTADHGEEFGEHGLYSEHWSTHDGTQRVPLLIKPPVNESVDTGLRDHLVTNIDLAPTIVDYANIDCPDRWQGKSLRPIIENANEEGRDHIVVDHGLYTAQRAVRTGRWKYIRTYHSGNWDIPERQLFDMKNDPWEQENVAEDHADLMNELETKMVIWAEEHIGRDEDELHAVAREGPAGLYWANQD